MNKSLTAALLGLLVLRAAALWFGYDRLPLLPNTDEVIINDPAVAFARGEGVVAPSFAGTLDLERAYGIHPPLYMWVQGFIFKVFGFSTFTLRFLGMASHLASLAVWIWALGAMWRKGWVDAFGLGAAAILLLTEPLTFMHARWGRHDSFAILFGVLGFARLVRGEQPAPTAKSWITAGVLIGLALAAHLQMVLFSVPFSLWAAWHFRKSNRLLGLVVIALPIAVLAAIWVLAYGSESLLAWRQLRHHSSVHYVGFDVRHWWYAIRDRHAQDFSTKGGLAFLAVMLSWLAMTARWAGLAVRPGHQPENTRRILLMCLAFAVTQYLLFRFLMGTGAQRVYTALPLAAAGLAMALSNLRPRFRVTAGLLAGVLGLAGGGMVAAYLGKAAAEWDRRDPHRLDALVDSLPSEARIASVPDLWYSFTSRGRRVRVIEQGFIVDDRHWREHPEAMNHFDILVFFEGHKYLEEGLVPPWPRRTVDTPSARYVILAKGSSPSPAENPRP